MGGRMANEPGETPHGWARQGLSRRHVLRTGAAAGATATLAWAAPAIVGSARAFAAGTPAGACPPVIVEVTCTDRPVPVGDEVTVTVVFTDCDLVDSHTVEIDWGDGTASLATVTEPVGDENGRATATHTYSAPGLYPITATVTDSRGTSVTSAACGPVLVFNPGAGFLTGGGWFDSPPGSFAPDPAVAGRGSFGVVAKYLPGNRLKGNLELQVHDRLVNFHSTGLDLLLVTDTPLGPRAEVRGRGRMNGVEGFSFLFVAYDFDTGNNDNANTGDAPATLPPEPAGFLGLPPPPDRSLAAKPTTTTSAPTTAPTTTTATTAPTTTAPPTTTPPETTTTAPPPPFSVPWVLGSSTTTPSGGGRPGSGGPGPAPPATEPVPPPLPPPEVLGALATTTTTAPGGEPPPLPPLSLPPPGLVVDGIRVKVWHTVTGNVVYDTHPGLPDGAPVALPMTGGNVTVHRKG
jgi:hypothetical protein